MPAAFLCVPARSGPRFTGACRLALKALQSGPGLNPPEPSPGRKAVISPLQPPVDPPAPTYPAIRTARPARFRGWQ